LCASKCITTTCTLITIKRHYYYYATVLEKKDYRKAIVHSEIERCNFELPLKSEKGKFRKEGEEETNQPLF